ncbi:MAG: hypothetical protein ABW170_17835 [Candidatus Thiodiazotropha sp. L084R]
MSNRIHVFDHLVAPLITHYEKSNRLVRVDGSGVVEAVFQGMLEAIEGSTENRVESKPKVNRNKVRVEQASAGQKQLPAATDEKSAEGDRSKSESEAASVEEKTGIKEKKKPKEVKKAKPAGKRVVKKKKSTSGAGTKKRTQKKQQRSRKKQKLNPSQNLLQRQARKSQKKPDQDLGQSALRS